MIRLMIRLILPIAIFQISFAYSHAGGLDKTGGHHNRKTGEYHCHRPPCTNTRSQVEKATQEAEQQGRSFSLLYNRDDWEHWIDADGDCEDTRAEILIRDSQRPVTFDSGGCTVTGGLWPLPYMGGHATDSGEIDIDHIIPLKWAHGHGGDRWSPELKRAFANDPDNLLSVYYSANRSKGSKGPDDWMPPLDQCGYAERWERLLEKYQLIVVPGEQAAIGSACQ